MKKLNLNSLYEILECGEINTTQLCYDLISILNQIQGLEVDSVIESTIESVTLEKLCMTDEEVWDYVNMVSDPWNEISESQRQDIQVVVQWPESQNLCENDSIESYLITDPLGMKMYGESAYLVPMLDYEAYKQGTQLSHESE